MVLGAYCCQQVVESKEHQDGEVSRGNANVDDELEEVLEVAHTDTVVDPRAVVVHPEDADATLPAVVGANWLPCFCSLTLFAVFDFHKLALKWRFHSFFDLTWVRERCSEVA